MLKHSAIGTSIYKWVLLYKQDGVDLLMTDPGQKGLLFIFIFFNTKMRIPDCLEAYWRRGGAGMEIQKAFCKQVQGENSYGD